MLYYIKSSTKTNMTDTRIMNKNEYENTEYKNNTSAGVSLSASTHYHYYYFFTNIIIKCLSFPSDKVLLSFSFDRSFHSHRIRSNKVSFFQQIASHNFTIINVRYKI